MSKDAPAHTTKEAPDGDDALATTNGMAARSEVDAPALASGENGVDISAEVAGENPTGPLDTGDSTVPRNTTPLADTAAPPRPPLESKAIAGGRYRIVTLLGSPHGTNVYRVTDTQGYRQCWACGSSASMEGDVYCVECGAQLTDRYYRLQEWEVSKLEGSKVEKLEEAAPKEEDNSSGDEEQPSTLPTF